VPKGAKTWTVFDQVRHDGEKFTQVHVDAELGTVAWPGDVDLDPDVLYGRYEPDPPVTSSGASCGQLPAAPPEPRPFPTRQICRQRAGLLIGR
jgi:hypothetical protein